MTTYVIDGDGHRVGKNTAGVLTKYVFDGDTVIGETTNSAETFHLPGIGFATSSAQNYYQENALGSTLSVRTNAGALSSRNEYDGYGITYAQVAGPQSEFRFAGAHGYQTDDDTSLQLLGHRYYVPQIGRFLTVDPTGQKDDLNLYGYCKDNPITRDDPTGLAYSNDGQSWNLSLGLLGDFLSGTGSPTRNYGADSTQVKTFLDSQGGKDVLSQLQKQQYALKSKGGDDLPTTFGYSFFVEPMNGIQFQLGSFDWHVESRNKNLLNIVVHNDLTLNSLAYHIPKHLGIANPASSSGRLGTIHEFLRFTVQIPEQYQNH
jgi:RHS repeat-associated protein